MRRWVIVAVVAVVVLAGAGVGAWWLLRPTAKPEPVAVCSSLWAYPKGQWYLALLERLRSLCWMSWKSNFEDLDSQGLSGHWMK
mgnify:CR=1 FL=1